MWFFKKKPIATICVEVIDVVATASLESYKDFASRAYGCTPEQIETAVGNHWANLELGKLKPEEFWDNVGADISAMGVVHSVPGWKFKGIWEGVVSDTIKLNTELINTIRQLRTAKLRTVATANITEELATAFQKAGAFEPFSMAVLSCQINARKPSSGVFSRMCKLTRTSAGECLYIDKDQRNLDAAKAAGYRVLPYTDNAQDLRWELLQLGLLN